MKCKICKDFICELDEQEQGTDYKKTGICRFCKKNKAKIMYCIVCKRDTVHWVFENGLYACAEHAISSIFMPKEKVAVSGGHEHGR